MRDSIGSATSFSHTLMALHPGLDDHLRMIRKEVMIYFDELTVLLLLLMSFLLLLLIIFIVSIFVASASPIY